MIVSKCVVCGGKVEESEVNEEMRVGNDFVVIENVTAGVCMECGERYYPPGVVDRPRYVETRAMNQKKLKRWDVVWRAYGI
ncbi:MAG: YgiT-type zinc finger protein [Euryarchaeota archaeon]|nr:MAG: hypothetical protein C5S47_00685 [ANME-2 cluster archaeon]MEA1866045.1 YgiT-type zinc finger protein [Euryarchaeota archaeon]